MIVARAKRNFSKMVANPAVDCRTVSTLNLAIGARTHRRSGLTDHAMSAARTDRRPSGEILKVRPHPFLRAAPAQCQSRAGEVTSKQTSGDLTGKTSVSPNTCTAKS
jgi:hypothetical protein